MGYGLARSVLVFGLMFWFGLECFVILCFGGVCLVRTWVSLVYVCGWV